MLKLTTGGAHPKRRLFRGTTEKFLHQLLVINMGFFLLVPCENYFSMKVTEDSRYSLFPLPVT